MLGQYRCNGNAAAILLHASATHQGPSTQGHSGDGEQRDSAIMGHRQPPTHGDALLLLALCLPQHLAVLLELLP